MCLIGIDISKYKHDCFIASETGEVVQNSFSFDNNQEKRIGMASTGHYKNNLMQFLDEHIFSFMVFNPYLTKMLRQSSFSRNTKTDKIDARIIFQKLVSRDYNTCLSKSYHISTSNSITRSSFRLIEFRTKLKVRVKNIIDLTFPKILFYYVWRITIENII